jgi:glycosyltransferase involved in cell wall biosynthesis
VIQDRRLKLAVVSPLPPLPTGIADYTLDVVRSFQGFHRVELFHDQARVSDGLPAPAFEVGQMEGRSRTCGGFDAVLYQMGNGPAHDFIYDWLERVPGIVILHDLVLHHSFARRYLESPESIAYAALPSSRDQRLAAEATHRKYVMAVEAAYPGLGQSLAATHFNSVGKLLPYAYPLFEPALRRALAVGAHNSFMIEAIRSARPDLPCGTLAMPIEPFEVAPRAVTALRLRLGLEIDAPVIGCFGLVTPEKGIESVARAVARIGEIHRGVRLLLAGGVADPAWLAGLLGRTGIAKRTIVAGRLEMTDFMAAMSLSDVVVHLRYPTARETSAALLRVLAQGRPVIISDLANQAEIPRAAARRVDPCDEEGDLARALDWAFSNPAAVQGMGDAGRRFAIRAHSLQKTRESYDELLNSVAPLYSRPLS